MLHVGGQSSSSRSLHVEHKSTAASSDGIELISAGSKRGDVNVVSPVRVRPANVRVIQVVCFIAMNAVSAILDFMW
jgi:hypothetical protein